MYSAYKLNKQGDNTQPWCTPFPIWNQSVVPCPVLTVASWPAYRFLKRQVRWSGTFSGFIYDEACVLMLCLFCCCSITKSCLTLCNPMDCSTPSFPVLHYLLEFAQIHVHWVSDAIQSSHPPLLPSPCALNLSQHQGLFQWVSSSNQVAEVEFNFSISPSNEYSGFNCFYAHFKIYVCICVHVCKHTGFLREIILKENIYAFLSSLAEYI